MISFVVLKPHFIYDHNKKQYKEFGSTNDKTLLSLPVLAIVLAIIMGIIFCNIKGNPEHVHTQIQMPSHVPTPISYYPVYAQPFMHPVGQSYYKPNLVQ